MEVDHKWVELTRKVSANNGATPSSFSRRNEIGQTLLGFSAKTVKETRYHITVVNLYFIILVNVNRI